jgi:hypothetical protein
MESSVYLFSYIEMFPEAFVLAATCRGSVASVVKMFREAFVRAETCAGSVASVVKMFR